jgi:hypothetical protein
MIIKSKPLPWSPSPLRLLPVCCAHCGGALRERTLHSRRVSLDLEFFFFFFPLSIICPCLHHPPKYSVLANWFCRILLHNDFYTCWCTACGVILKDELVLQGPNRFWAALHGINLFLDFRFFSNASRNKLRMSANFMILGATDQSYGCLKFLGEVWAGRPCAGTNEKALPHME